MMILNPALLTEKAQNEIIAAFHPLKDRNVLETAEEINQEDRVHFDHTTLRAFGIDKYYGEIKAALLSMQQVRYTVRE